MLDFHIPDQFPINRRHHGLATVVQFATNGSADRYGFSIKRRHQGLATDGFLFRSGLA